MLSITASYPCHFVEPAPLGILYNGHAGLGANAVDRGSKNEVLIETLEIQHEGIVTDNKDPDKLVRAQGAVSACLPEIGDEVLVAFEHGGLRHPLLIASLWNSGGKPPETSR
ncbi:MAG TPA: phage baseplate assembly protein V [Burkholderiaceae bacterium]